MTYREALHRAGSALTAAGVPDADIDARLLLEFCCGSDLAFLLAHGGDEMPSTEFDAFWRLVEKRGKRIPLQQLTGEQEFCGISFRVSEHVLIPRQDTETLVEEALKRVSIVSGASTVSDAGTDSHVRVLDLCTGSGCVLISILKLGERYGLSGVGSDVSDEALALAGENAKRAGVSDRAKIVKSDLFDNISGRYDIITSNPPYIRSAEIDGLMAEVRDHEPHLALDGGADGLEFYRRIAKDAPEFLDQGGWLLFETGADEGPDVCDILRESGFSSVETVKDLGGNDRVVLGQVCWSAH